MNVSTPLRNNTRLDISMLYRLACEKLLAKDNGTVGEEIVSCVKVLGKKPELNNIPLELFFTTGFASKVILTVLYGLAFTVAVIGNILVVLTFVFNPLMRSTTNSFIVSLAVSDFLMAITCMPINLGTVYTSYWIFGSFACKLVPYVMTVAVSCSSLTLCCIALDRYKAIVHPLKLTYHISPCVVGGVVVTVWILAALSAVPNAVFFRIENVYINYSDNNSGGLHNPIHFSFPLCAWLGTSTQEISFLLFQLVALFIAPLSVMIIFYGIIGYRLWIRKPIGTRTQHHGNKNTRVKKKVIKMLVIVVTLFAVCWLPLNFFNIIICITKKTKALWTLRHYLHLLAMSSTCYNPVVYTIMNENFKNKFANVLFCRRNQVRPEVPKFRRDQVNITRIRIQTVEEENPSLISVYSSPFQISTGTVE